MLLEFKCTEFLKFSCIFSILFFLLCLQTLTFSDVFSTNNKAHKSTNEGSLTNSVKKNFSNISDNDKNNNTSVNQNQTINEQKIKIVAAPLMGYHFNPLNFILSLKRLTNKVIN